MFVQRTSVDKAIHCEGEGEGEGELKQTMARCDTFLPADARYILVQHIRHILKTWFESIFHYIDYFFLKKF